MCYTASSGGLQVKWAKTDDIPMAGDKCRCWQSFHCSTLSDDFTNGLKDEFPYSIDQMKRTGQWIVSDWIDMEQGYQQGR